MILKSRPTSMWSPCLKQQRMYLLFTHGRTYEDITCVYDPIKICELIIYSVYVIDLFSNNWKTTLPLNYVFKYKCAPVNPYKLCYISFHYSI